MIGVYFNIMFTTLGLQLKLYPNYYLMFCLKQGTVMDLRLGLVDSIWV